MKFTVTFLALLCTTSSWTVLAKQGEDSKDKREASYASTSGHSPSSYPSPSSGHSPSSYQGPSVYQSSPSYQPQSSLSHGDASAISVGAGYSIGGAKPSYSFGGQGSGLEGLQSGGQGIQFAPITLQPGQDLSQIMSQLQHSLNSGALTLQPSNTIAELHEGGQAGQGLSHGQFNYGSPNLQQYVLAGSVASAPSYSAGTKGLSSYGSTGPVLFNPSSEAQSHGSAAALTFASQSGGQSLGDAGSLSGGHYGGFSLGAPGQSAELSYGGSGLSLGSLGHSLGASGQSLGHSLGGAGGHSFGGAGLSLGGSGGHSFGGSGHSLGGSGLSYGSSDQGLGHSLGSAGNSIGGYYKVSSGHGHGSPGKSAFKPSAFLGASVPSDSGFSGISGSHGGSSFPSFSGHSTGSHGLNFGGFGSLSGPSKSISPLYTKSVNHGADSAAAYSTAGQYASPPGTTYGFPTASYPAGAIQAASSVGPHYTSSSKYPSAGFGEGSFSYKSPGSSHSALSSQSSGPKYSFGGQGSSSGRYSFSPKDSHGAYSETSYNTIKYSEELKPRP